MCIRDRANYTYTDSEQRTGPNAGQPLAQSARHMANATLDWTLSDAVSLQLTSESRSKRFRNAVDADGNLLFYKSYNVLHLGGQYRVNEHVAINARINNLLDEDFTSFRTSFTANPDGSFTPVYTDDYNNKDKSRSYWLSLNVSF